MNTQLVQKYNVPAPRYTSYPTVPHWQTEAPTVGQWTQKVLNAFEKDNNISLYIHLPFCEKLCTYCGCNKRITKNHKVEMPYIDAVLQEWDLYLAMLPQQPIIKELHLGGGTPTFFSPSELKRLVRGILDKSKLSEQTNFSFEVHPASTTTKHLKALYEVGFTRLSIGVQDFDNDILKIINRQQSVEDVWRVTTEARAIGYDSINYDLIYGLPLQEPRHIHRNMRLLEQLRPNRIAFYSYAHVPWSKPSQRAYSKQDLPLGLQKQYLFEIGKQYLFKMGYKMIGFDHFALPTDPLSKATEAKQLHRNFMGYTEHQTTLNLALGTSSIGDTGDAYIQNEKHIETYQALVADGQLPIIKGHLLSPRELVIRQHILRLMCQLRTNWMDEEDQDEAIYEAIEQIDDLEKDGLVMRLPYQLRVTEKGRHYLRNICMAIDPFCQQRDTKAPIFSQAV